MSARIKLLINNKPEVVCVRRSWLMKPKWDSFWLVVSLFLSYLSAIAPASAQIASDGTLPTSTRDKLSDATSYVVCLNKGSDLVWEQKVSGTKCDYPQDAPPLEPLITYLITVAAKNDQSLIKEAQAEYMLLEESTQYDVKAVNELIKTDEIRSNELEWKHKVFEALHAVFLGDEVASVPPPRCIPGIPCLTDKTG